MPDGIDIKIEGLDALKATFQALATKGADRCVLKALQAGAVIEQAAITERAPVKDTTGGMLPDGALKSDIVITTHRNKSRDTPYVTVAPGKYTSHVALWVEYGHRLIRGGYSRLLKSGKTRGPGAQIGTVPAHPFIRPAYEASRQEVAAAIASTLVTEIQKSASKGGKP
jgi:HK97 gp10 family phage protein